MSRSKWIAAAAPGRPRRARRAGWRPHPRPDHRRARTGVGGLCTGPRRGVTVTAATTAIATAATAVLLRSPLRWVLRWPRDPLRVRAIATATTVPAATARAATCATTAGATATTTAAGPTATPRRAATATGATRPRHGSRRDEQLAPPFAACAAAVGRLRCRAPVYRKGLRKRPASPTRRQPPDAHPRRTPPAPQRNRRQADRTDRRAPGKEPRDRARQARHRPCHPRLRAASAR